MVYREGVCCVGFTPDKEQIVLTKRRDLSVWYLPGGGIEQEETPEQATAREFNEETGLEVEIEVFHGKYDLKIPRFHPIFYDRSYVYSGIITGGKITLNDEAKEVKMFEVTNLPKGLPFYQRRVIADAVKGIAYSSPVTQQVRARDLLELLGQNLQVLKHPLTLFKNLTISSPKRE